MASIDHLAKIREYANEGDFNPEIYTYNACSTYEEIGNMLTQLLGYFAGSGNYDERIEELITDMVDAYAAEAV